MTRVDHGIGGEGGTRRQMLAGLGAGLAGAMLAGGAGAAPPMPPPLDEFGYGDVTLLDGPAKAQAARTLDTLLAIDEAALLRPFHAAAGLPVAATGLGGWYDASPRFDPPKDMHGFIPGHSFGQYVSALARSYAVSGDARAKAKVDRLVAGLAPTLGADFYRDYPLPAYTYDKVLVGLIDAHLHAGNAQARALIGPATDQVLRYLPGRAQDRQLVKVPPGRNAAFGWDETYTLPENLYRAADAGAGARFRPLARAYLLDATYFDPLAAGRNVLPGRHAYSHVNALASAMRAYLVDGDPKHLAAARNGLSFVLEQSFATGGWGPNEGFVRPGSGDLGRSLSTTHASFEAPCGCYGHFKVARALMRATRDSRWGDGMERLLYNAALGVLPLRADGTAFYYADYNDSGTKRYFDYACPCCSGSIGQLTADYGINSYLRDAQGVFVNLYLPSTVTWQGGGGGPLTLTQNGGYPLSGEIMLTVATPRPTAMALRLRIPAWAGPATRLTVNGRAVPPPTPGRFATIRREWRAGDRVMLTLDMPLRAEPVDAQTPDRVAMMQGPLALFATGGAFAPIPRARLAGLRQRAPGASEWLLPGGPAPVFRPWTTIGGEPGRLYQIAT